MTGHDQVRKKREEKIRELEQALNDARQGAREINRAVDALCIRMALDYGATLPDGGKVITLHPVSADLPASWRVIARRGKDAYQIEVRKQTAD